MKRLRLERKVANPKRERGLLTESLARASGWYGQDTNPKRERGVSSRPHCGPVRRAPRSRRHSAALGLTSNVTSVTAFGLISMGSPFLKPLLR